MTHNTGKYPKNLQINTKEVKNKILKYLYSSQVNLNLKYENIMSDNDLDDIRDNDYIVCPRFSGTRSWIIFFKDGENYYAVNFPKHSQRKREDLMIHPIDINVHPSFYLGTIMEGIFYRIEDYRYLTVDEVYILAGQNQLLKAKDDRLNYLNSFIKNSISVNPYFNIMVSQYYSIGKKSLQTMYEKIKSDSKIQEIIFYPKIYGRKIYTYTLIDTDLIDNIVKLTYFRLQKTTSPDVYNLLATESGNKVDIAYIPDMATSKKCKQWFKDNKNKELLVKCQMDINKKKWVPIEMVETDIDN